MEIIEASPCYKYAERTKDPLGKHCFIHDWYHTVEYLVSKRTDDWKKKEELMSKEFYGVTCLHSACTKNANRSTHAPLDVIKLMIKIGGMDLLMIKDDHCGYTPLQMLAYDHNTSIHMMEMLLVEGGGKELIMKSANACAYSILHELCIASTKWEEEDGALARINLVLTFGGRELLFSTTEKMGRTALHLSCMEHVSVNVINILVNEGKKELVMLKDNDGMTALHFLCMEIDEDLDPTCIMKIVLLLNCGGNDLLKERTKEGETAYDFAKAGDAPDEVLEALASKKSFFSRGKKSSQKQVIPSTAAGSFACQKELEIYICS
jgi:ankyrin repeat protein